MSKKYLSMVTSVVTGLSMVFGTISGVFAAEEGPSEIVSLRSEYEKHFDNGDGTITAFINTVPIHYLENGEWCEIDNTLVMDESGDYVNRSNSMNVTLSSGASAKAITAAGTDQMVKIERDGYTISWDMLNLQTNIADQISTTQMNPVSVLTISDDDDDNNIDLGGARLNEMADACVDKLDSGVVYQSVYEDVDIDIDINPTSVKETIILNSAESAPEQFAYYIMTDGLAAELQADNSIIFINDSGEVIFTMPAMYMFDASNNAENNYDIETSIEPFKSGYLLTITPDSEWLASEERVYPVMIDPEVEYEDNTGITDSYINEMYPDQNFTDQYLKMGGYYSDGLRKQTFIKLPDIFASFNNTVEILDAGLYLYFASNDLNGINPNIDVSLVVKDPGIPTWNTLSWKKDKDYIKVSSFQLDDYEAGYHNEDAGGIDITQAVSSWLNYAKTNQVTGAANYGLKLAPTYYQDDYDYRTLTAFSSRYQTLAPYYVITYTVGTQYTLSYTPDTYNALIAKPHLPKLQNLQYRMNCYAYALQVYYNGEFEHYSSAIECYPLTAGELGISYQLPSDQYPIANRGELDAYYNSFSQQFKSIMKKYPSTEVVNTNEFRSAIADFTDFVQEQMDRDARAILFDMERINCGATFSLPADFDQSDEKIIAMITYYTTLYGGAVDHHFYLRNGNGTCPNGHGGNCSMWTHKQGSEEIKNYPGGDSSILLCDANIGENAYNLDSKYNHLYHHISGNIRYYRINKDTYIYNSWHGDGRDEECTGTPYCQ